MWFLPQVPRMLVTSPERLSKPLVGVLQHTDPILILPLSLGCLQYGALSAFASLFLHLLV